MVSAEDTERTVKQWLEEPDKPKSKEDVERAVIKLEKTFNTLNFDLSKIPELRAELKKYIDTYRTNLFIPTKLVAETLREIDEILSIMDIFKNEIILLIPIMQEGIFRRKITIETKPEIRTVYIDSYAKSIMYNLYMSLEKIKDDKQLNKDFMEVVGRIINTPYQEVQIPVVITPNIEIEKEKSKDVREKRLTEELEGLRPSDDLIVNEVTPKIKKYLKNKLSIPRIQLYLKVWRRFNKELVDNLIIKLAEEYRKKGEAEEVDKERAEGEN